MRVYAQTKVVCCYRCHRQRHRWGCARSRPIPADVTEIRACPDPDHRQHISICQRCHEQLNSTPIPQSTDTDALLTLADVAQMSPAAINSQSILSVPQTSCNASTSSPPSSPPAPTDELFNQICDRLRRNDYSAEWSRDYERVLNRLIHCAPKKGKLIPCRGNCYCQYSCSSTNSEFD